MARCEEPRSPWVAGGGQLQRVDAVAPSGGIPLRNVCASGGNPEKTVAKMFRSTFAGLQSRRRPLPSDRVPTQLPAFKDPTVSTVNTSLATEHSYGL
uniref:Uncharacterized protein n=1 Tax=Trichuris muris TaxID=70415 RepID=A0A5S6QKF4_TRIMR